MNEPTLAVVHGASITIKPTKNGYSVTAHRMKLERGDKPVKFNKRDIATIRLPPIVVDFEDALEIEKDGS